MQNKIVLCATVAIALLCGSTAQMQAGTATNILKKTTGVVLGAVALGTAVDLGHDLVGVDPKRKVIDAMIGQMEEDYGIPVAMLFGICFAPSLLLSNSYDTSLLKGSKSVSFVVRLALLAATGYGSYKLLKPSADEQESDEEEYEYSY